MSHGENYKISQSHVEQWYRRGSILAEVKNAIECFSFSWNGNVQEIWDLQGSEPSFTIKYHVDYWLKNVLSLVVLFRNSTTHLHLVFYIVMLYPLLTRERPRLLLPWLYLQLAKNIVTDLICTASGVLLCWALHSCGLMALEFFVVQIVSTMPSVYLWRRLRSYYFDLHHAEFPGQNPLPPAKVRQRSMSLTQRRRATKSIDGTMSMTTSAENRSRINSCSTYEEFVGPGNWEPDVHVDNGHSISLTTLLTNDSQESDNAEEDDPCPDIIDDQNSTPAQKTLKILGLNRNEVDTIAFHLNKKTSTIELLPASQMNSNRDLSTDGDGTSTSVTSLIGEVVGIQLPRTNELQSNDSNEVSDLPKEEEIPRNCKCYEETECFGKENKDSDDDGDEDGIQSMEGKRNSEDSSSELEVFSGCSDINREGSAKCRGTQIDGQRKDEKGDLGNPDPQNGYALSATRSKPLAASSTCSKKNFYTGSRLRSVVERDGITGENLIEMNFVSMIDRAMYSDVASFKLQRDGREPGEGDEPISKNLPDGCEWEGIINEYEDGTRFNDRSLDVDLAPFLGKSATSYIQSFDPTADPIRKLIRPVNGTKFDYHLKSSLRRHSHMFDDTRAQLESPDSHQHRTHTARRRLMHEGVNEDSLSYQLSRNSVEEKANGSTDNLGSHRVSNSALQRQSDIYEGWDYSRGNLNGNRIDVVCDLPENFKLMICSAFQVAERVPSLMPSHMPEANHGLTRASQTPSIILNAETIISAGHGNVELDAEATTQTGERNDGTAAFTAIDKSAMGNGSCRKWSRERKSLANSSRTSKSSRNQETHDEEREAKEMQALRAYNEGTLFDFQKEMNAWDEFRNSSGNWPSRVSSVPRTGKPEEEPISNIRKAYARFARSQPVESVNSEAPRGNFVAKEYSDIPYNGYEKLKRESRNSNRLDDRAEMGKQHSEYSEFFTDERNDSDVTSRSCKKIDGLQKDRDLDRNLAKMNIRAKTVGALSLNAKLCDGGASIESVATKNIRSPAPQKDDDNLSSVSSEIVRSADARSQIVVRVADNSGKIATRLRDGSRCEHLKKNNVPEDLKEAVENIDWSFAWPVLSRSSDYRENESRTKSSGGTMGAAESSSGRHDIVSKTTENMLRGVFSNDENSERGFRLRGSGSGLYPIFNRVSIAVQEIVGNAAFGRYTDEFVSQPATEIEIPRVGEGDLCGLTGLRFEREGRSSTGIFGCCILSGNNTAPDKLSSENDSDLRQGKVNALRRGLLTVEMNVLSDAENEMEARRSSVNVRQEVKIPESFVTDDYDETRNSRSSLLSPTDDISFLDADDATADKARNENETAADTGIERLRSVFGGFYTGGQSRRDDLAEHETSSESKGKISSLSGSKFPINGELEKLQNLVTEVAHCVTIVEPLSVRSIESRNKAVGFHSLGPPSKNEAMSSDVAEVSRPSFSKNSENSVPSRREMDLLNSTGWGEVVPSPTRRQFAMGNRKSRPKEAVDVREPSGKTVKVIRLIEEKNSDFFGTRSVPQRGRGLSSGYLMDSDSDGNFTVPRPPTPASIDSETSRTFSCDNEEFDVFENPLEALEIFPVPNASHLPANNRPIETCWSSSSAHSAHDEFLSARNAGDHVESLGNRGSSEISGSLLSIDSGVSPIEKSTRAEIVDDHKNIGNEFYDKESSVLGDRVSLSDADGDLRHLPLADAAGIQNKPSDVPQQIFNRQFSPLSKAVQIGSTSPSFASISDVSRIRTEYNVEVPNDRFGMFERERIMKFDASKGVTNTMEDIAGSMIFAEKNSPTVSTDVVELPSGKWQGLHRLASISYDSFGSMHSKNMIGPSSKPARRAFSISDHTYFEEFPEHFDSGLQFLPGHRSGVDQESFEMEISLDGLDESDATARSAGSGSDAKSKRDTTSRKTGIPGPAKGGKEHK